MINKKLVERQLAVALMRTFLSVVATLKADAGIPMVAEKGKNRPLLSVLRIAG